LLGTSLGCFALAHVTLFALHLPNRYVVYTLPLFGLMWAAAVVPRLFTVLMPVTKHVPVLASLRCPPLWLALSGLLVVGTAVDAHRAITTELRRLPPPGQEAAYAFLATLPKTTLVAAHPLDASHVPLRSQRRVLAAMETALPYYTGYYRFVAERLRAALAATYAVHMAEVDALYEQYGVDVFLVNRQRYTAPGWRYDAPFQEAVRDQIQQGLQQGFSLLAPPPERRLFCAGEYCVIRLGPPRQLAGRRG
jgi:hypothetical protein